MENSNIAWTDNTFNPAMGCIKVSPGCTQCYAETLTKNRMHLSLWGPGSQRKVTSDAYWRGPIKWNREAAAKGESMRVFCASLCDVFEDHPTIDGLRPRLWELIRATPWLDWQLLTKRAERIASSLPDDWCGGYPNVWLGVSIENNDYAWRADYLRKIPAVVHFVSYEPALGPLDQLDLANIQWVIYGGESGAGFRRHNLDWPRRMQCMCFDAGAAFLYKQGSAYRPGMDANLDGQIIQNYPMKRRTRNEVIGSSKAGKAQLAFARPAQCE